MMFFDLLILLIFVWFCRKLFQLIKFPPLFGEVFAGVLAGPLILGLVGETEAIQVLAELGIFFLMFHSGMESDPKDLFQASKPALMVAIAGFILPFAGGYGVAHWYGYDAMTSFFMGIGLSITAVAITARLFKDAKIHRTAVANTTMTAAIITEILLLVVFSVFLDFYRTGILDPEHVTFLVLKFIAYFAVVFYVGDRLFGYLYRIIYKGNKGFTFTLILALLFGVLAEWIGLHMIIGAFLAGLFIRGEMLDPQVYAKIEDRVYGLSYSFLGPIFFATLAFHLDLSAFWTLPGFVFLMLVVATLSKIIGSGLAARWGARMSGCESLVVGLAMNSRGAVDLIIASIGYKEGIIGPELFSVLVIIAFATTLISIMSIKPLVPSILNRHCQMTLKQRLMKIVT